MAIKEYCLEMRGMPRRDLEDYFRSIGCKQIGSETYKGPNWEVDLSDEGLCVLGAIQIPSTKVAFRADERDWAEIVKAFRLRFLSAGG